MSDPRNVAHAKKVKQEKEHAAPGASSGAKPKKQKKAAASQTPEGESTEAPKVEQGPGELEKSVAVLSKLKDMEFHSRANIEALAGLILTIEEELKQKEFSGAIGEVCTRPKMGFTRKSALIESYEAKCESLKPAQ